MQKTNSVTTNSGNNILISTVEQNKIVTVVTTIITTITQAKCALLLYNGGTLVHTITFEPGQQETIFIDSKLFLPEGYSLKIQSQAQDTTFTVMYDQSDNQ